MAQAKFCWYKNVAISPAKLSKENRLLNKRSLYGMNSKKKKKKRTLTFCLKKYRRCVNGPHFNVKRKFVFFFYYYHDLI